MNLKIETHDINLLADNAFHFEILNMPYVTYMAQSFELPGIVLGEAYRPTPLVDDKEPGDTIMFNPLQINFLIDEGMKNYLEVWKWIVHLGAPRHTDQYKNLIEEESPYTRRSDLAVHILSNKHQIKETVIFLDAWPQILSDVTFALDQDGVRHPIANVSFSYLLYFFQSDDTFVE